MIFEKEGILIVMFESDTCMFCKDVYGIIQTIKKLKPNAKSIIINVSKNMDIAIQHSINQVPTVDIYSDGDLIDRIVGNHPLDTYMRKIA
jgi:thioredoxin-like negative regulator of GroEL